MMKFISTACAAALIGSAAIGPATAAPLQAPQLNVQANDSVIYVGKKGKKKGKHRHSKRPYHYNHDRYYYRRGSSSYGWVVPGLIIGGIIVGSALSQPRYQYRQPAGSCGYWSQRCSANWSRPSDYRGCMRYYGC